MIFLLDDMTWHHFWPYFSFCSFLFSHCFHCPATKRWSQCTTLQSFFLFSQCFWQITSHYVETYNFTHPNIKNCITLFIFFISSYFLFPSVYSSSLLSYPCHIFRLQEQSVFMWESGDMNMYWNLLKGGY